MNEYEVIVAPRVSRVFHVTAESPERAVELIAGGEEERDGEQVVHVRDKEHGYDVAGVSPMDRAVGDFVA
jgi:hypothetical protein